MSIDNMSIDNMSPDNMGINMDKDELRKYYKNMIETEFSDNHLDDIMMNEFISYLFDNGIDTYEEIMMVGQDHTEEGAEVRTVISSLLEEFRNQYGERPVDEYITGGVRRNSRNYSKKKRKSTKRKSLKRKLSKKRKSTKKNKSKRKKTKRRRN